jgi:hypothetical protein
MYKKPRFDRGVLKSCSLQKSLYVEIEKWKEVEFEERRALDEAGVGAGLAVCACDRIAGTRALSWWPGGSEVVVSTDEDVFAVVIWALVEEAWARLLYRRRLGPC